MVHRFCYISSIFRKTEITFGFSNESRYIILYQVPFGKLKVAVPVIEWVFLNINHLREKRWPVKAETPCTRTRGNWKSNGSWFTILAILIFSLYIALDFLAYQAIPDTRSKRRDRTKHRRTRENIIFRDKNRIVRKCFRGRAFRSSIVSEHGIEWLATGGRARTVSMPLPAVALLRSKA